MRFSSIACVVALILLGDATESGARPSLRVRPQLEVSSGYDTNAYLDASAQPSRLASDVTEAGGPVLRVRPSLGASWRPTASQQLFAIYEARFVQFLGGDAGDETAIRHGGALGYMPPAFWGFELLFQGGVQQLVFRMASVGWWQGFARLRLSRELFSRFSLGLSYVGGYVSYEDGDSDGDSQSLASQEWTHGAELALGYRPWSWLALGASYGLARTQASPRSFVNPAGQTVNPPDDAFDGWRHSVAADVVLSPSGIALSLGLGYRLWVVDFDAHTPRGPGPGSSAQAPTISTASRLHQLSARASWQLWRFLAIQLRYVALFGETDAYTPATPTTSASRSTSTTQRHLLLAGLVIEWGFAAGRVGAPRRERIESGRLRLRVIAPDAKEVSVIGTFNGWNRQAGHLRRGAGGTWVGSFALPPGEHRYSLWIDGDVRPPTDCPTLVPDGFGGQNCAISWAGGSP